MFKDNRNKSGINRWVHNESGKSYVGSAVNISRSQRSHERSFNYSLKKIY